MTLSNLAYSLENLSIELIAEEEFDLEKSISDAMHILRNLVADKDYDYRSVLEFEKNAWVVPNNGGTLKFNFEDLEVLIKQHIFSNSSYYIKQIKCWTCILLRSYSVEHAHRLHSYLKIIIEKTNFLNVNKAEEFTEFIRTTTKYSNNIKNILIQVTLNFLDYGLQNETYEIYNSEFYSISSQIKPISNRRNLPPAKEVITFSMWLEHFFYEEYKLDIISPALLRYYPIVIWWKLTSIIPIRPSEFCSINRNALISTENGFYLKLPRIKNKKNVQVIDEISISNELGSIIEEYINITNIYGKSKTLISYRSIFSTYNKRYQDATRFIKYDFDVFNYSDLLYQLNSFHDEILVNKFNVKVVPYKKVTNKESFDRYDISRRILPGDTRHLAIMSLINQKFHPVEVARLAGHTSLSSYFHYSNHQTYWVDLEIHKLMHKFHGEKNDIVEEHSIWSQVSKRALLKEPTTNYNEKLLLGYCTDNLKRCFTDCIFCEHWRISFKEFEINRDLIEEMIAKHKTTATGLLTDIFNMMQAFDIDEFASINPDIKNSLDEKLMMLDDSIQKISKIKLIEEVNISNDF